MKKLYICGDSFMTPSPETPGQHFSEILSTKIGYDLTILSRGGMSNGGICVQLEHAIEKNADFIIVNTTLIDRLEIPINPIGSTLYGHESDVTLDNILYKHQQSISSFDPEKNKDPKMISDTIQSMLPDYPYTQYEDTVPNLSTIKENVKLYFANLYDHNWKLKIDTWCVYAMLHKLEESKIPYLLILDDLKIKDKCSWLNEKNTTVEKQQWWNACQKNIKAYNKRNPIKFKDPGYHTLPLDQENLANTLLEHIDRYTLIN
jgi:hypothetical protein